MEEVAVEAGSESGEPKVTSEAHEFSAQLL